MADKHKWHDVIVAMANGLDVQYEHNGGWYKLTDKGVNPFSYPHWNWRIKPKTIMIGDIESPEPCRDAPEIGDMYFLVNVTQFLNPAELEWNSDCDDYRWLQSGLIHLTKQAAIDHGRALIRITSIQT